MSMPNIVVLGTGMAGFGAAYRLHQQGIVPVMYDKNPYYGGHTTSFRYDSGFLFDVGPHISFTNDIRIQNLLADSVGQRYETIQINLITIGAATGRSIRYSSIFMVCPKRLCSRSSAILSKNARRRSGRFTITPTGSMPALAKPSPNPFPCSTRENIT